MKIINLITYKTKILFFFLISDRGKARFEATVRLGNASLFNLNENGEKRVNQHYKLLLEKHVSFATHIYSNFF